MKAFIIFGVHYNAQGMSQHPDKLLGVFTVELDNEILKKEFPSFIGFKIVPILLDKFL